MLIKSGFHDKKTDRYKMLFLGIITIQILQVKVVSGD